MEEKEKKKIYFIGRKEGLGRFHVKPPEMERLRRGELDGFRKQAALEPTRLPGRADIIFARNVPEETTDDELDALTEFVARYDDGTRVIVNPPKAFLATDSKDRTFDTWKGAGIPCPRHWVLETRFGDPADLGCVDRVSEILADHARVVVRTNNEFGGHGIHVVDRDTPRDRLVEVVRDLKGRAAELHRTRKDTKIIAVEYADARDGDGFASLARVFVLLDRVIGYFAVVSEKLNIHPADMGPRAFDRFFAANRRLRRMVEDPDGAAEILGAVHSLGGNLGAVDFLMHEDGGVTYLEVNPMWGPVPEGECPFGTDGFEKLMVATKSFWKKEFPNLVENLDVKRTYKDMFEYMAAFAGRAEDAATVAP